MNSTTSTDRPTDERIITGSETSWTIDGFLFLDDTDTVWFVRHTDVISREPQTAFGNEKDGEEIRVKTATVHAEPRF
jgi:hypothetical protein